MSGAGGNGAEGAESNGAGRGARGGAAGDGAGTLMIVGGREDKTGDRLILRALARRADGGALVVVTAASNLPAELWADYEPVFRDLGVRDVRHLHADTRQEAADPERVRLLDGAAVVFFTGGNQLKLTSQLGGTPLYDRLRDLYVAGGCVAGTSAGASVVCETMMVSGAGSSTTRVGEAPRMAPGFGLLRDVIVDQHFAERGRIGRLIGAVAQNPRILGVGIDENTAIVCERGERFTVLGAGGVYVLDGRDAPHDNVVEEEQGVAVSVFGLRLHLLGMGDEFDLVTRRPHGRPAAEAAAAVGAAP